MGEQVLSNLDFSQRIGRENVLQAHAERWKPPALVAQTESLTGRIQLFFDLQTRSIWHDLSKLLPQTQGTLLDVGCGAQPYRALIPKGCTYTAIDNEIATEFGYRAPDTTYYSGDFWPTDDASADVVLATETLEHVRDTVGFLKEARRTLKPRGTLILTVPFAARWHFIPHDYWRFTPSGLEKVLRESGFQNVQVFARGSALTVACYKAMAIILKLLMPQRRNLASMSGMLAGIALIPVMALLAAIGNLSLWHSDCDDCLGYTAVAV